jgi:CHAT domain-containing protein
VLADGEILGVDRLARLHVAADLATLSACESAKGAFARGEGVVGWSRAFFLAGVPRVMTSAWVVSDRATRPFMKRFYEAHLKQGLPAATALADAKRAAIREGGDAASPAHWAAFTLWGLPD